MELNRRFYPAVTGLLLGLLQTGLFFQLTFTLSSSFRTFLLVTLCWLIGSAVGVTYAAKLHVQLEAFIGLALIAYFACAILLKIVPFGTQLWPVYAVLIGLTGIYPGVFFARMAAFYTARDLFLYENNGFLVGLVLGTLLFMLFGRVILVIAPIFVAAVVVKMGDVGHNRMYDFTRNSPDYPPRSAG
ncbi:MAG: hypothetical protein H7Y09_01465 [Chitinophagaceae bacterium]|nr:hypothetical protein [Anaerolineae bacterium]